VDKNPLAVELCKVALWIEGHTLGKPLTFLDHRIRCGDSLVGVFNLSVLEEGIPEEAYEPAGDDDSAFARRLRSEIRRQRRERKTLGSSFFHPAGIVEKLAKKLAELAELPENTPEEVQRKSARYVELQRDPELERLRLACDLWTAAFFARLRPEEASRIPKPLDLQGLLEKGRAGVKSELLGAVEAMAHRLRFFHWPLEFPEVFAQGGFDVVLCNPPWERIKLQEEEFFATRDKEIATAPNKAARERLIRELPVRNPALWQEYQQALHDADALSKFLRGSNRFPLTARGDINTYSVFAELFTALVNDRGRVGVVLPTGIATDATNQQFFRHLVDAGRLVSLYDFDNRARLFPAVISLMKFCLLTLSGTGARNQRPEFAFFCHRPEDLRQSEKILQLSPEDILLLNPNTRTLPIFRTRQDAELTKAIYQRVPVLVNETSGENPWGVRFLAMFHMANDSHLFRTREELERAGYRRVGNRFLPPPGGEGLYLPLYEAKMIWHYDHRFGTYEGVDSRSSTQLPTPDERQHADPNFVVQPWYWVPAEEVEARLGDWKRGWLLGFRRIARATDERTAIFTLLPRAGAGDNVFLLLPNASSVLTITLTGNLISLPFDWVVRQKLAGVNMNFFYVEQLPVLPPRAYTPESLGFIVPRVLELVYTSWDIKPFADDVWREAGEDLRARIRRQWEENAAETGGHRWEPPDWLEAYPEIHIPSAPVGATASKPFSPWESNPSPLEGEGGIPLPPFKWDEERRARIRAELDAYYAKLYGLTRKQLRYILDPADLTERELADILDPWEEVADPLDPAGYAERCRRSTFPGETFRVLKEKELRQYGEYRTRRLVLEAWERLKEGC